VSYVARCGQFVGGEKGAQAMRASGSLFLTGQTLVNKHGGSWKRAAWEFIHGDPNYRPDPLWATTGPADRIPWGLGRPSSRPGSAVAYG